MSSRADHLACQDGGHLGVGRDRDPGRRVQGRSRLEDGSSSAGGQRSNHLPGRLLSQEAVYPHDEEHRYRIYARRGDELHVLACADRDGIGLAILTLHADCRKAGRRLADLGAFGLYDAVAGEWIVMPWLRGPS